VGGGGGGAEVGGGGGGGGGGVGVGERLTPFCHRSGATAMLRRRPGCRRYRRRVEGASRDLGFG